MSVRSGSPDAWWARGLSLLERLPPANPPDAVRCEHAHRRLERWLEAHDLGPSGQFARRLADAGLDETTMVGLLAEAPESLAARTDRPTWATFVDRALARPPVAADGEHESGRATWQGQFAASLGRLTAVARDRVSGGIQLRAATAARLDLAALSDGFAVQLGTRLARLAARTLVLELNVARVSGQLAGSTAAERFAEFAGQLSTRDGLAALFAEYPVLARLLGQTCQHAVDAHVELLTRFAEDRAAIVDTLLGGIDPGVLQAIEPDQGDSHQRGRAVAVLRFASGARIVYKPRSQALQERFGELVGWLNDKVPGLGLRTVATLPQCGYGWLEFVAHRPCADLAEVDRFYRRQGALLALLYALDGTDIHYENLIAAGDQPVLVDVETLFHPTLSPAMTAGSDPAAHALNSSVCRTALLPLLLIGERGALDVSGLGGDPGATFPFDAVGWDETGTDEMRLVRQAIEFPGGINRPRLAGQDVDPGVYRAALLTGFRAGYDGIVAHREELLEPDGLLDRSASAQLRIVIRPTQLYASLLDESTHPDVLRDGLDRDPVFDLLWAESIDDTVKGRLIRHEVTDLWAGDVPIFVGRAASRDVWTATGECLPGLLAESGLAAVRAKIVRMDEVDRHEQEWLITATFATRTGPIRHRAGEVLPGPVAAAAPDPQRLLAAACAIADEIVARAAHDVDRANWLGLELIDDRHWAVLPMGAGLANGYPGVALFLAQLGELTGTARYLSLAGKALRPVPRLLETLAANPSLCRTVGPGGFLGLGGICYALARTSSLLGDPEVRGWLDPAVDLTLVGDDGRAGLADGRAGGVLALLAVQAETGLADAHHAAEVLADRLAASVDEPPEPGQFPATGFAGGYDGIAYALTRFTGERFADAAALARRRATALRDRRDHGWCSGLAGAVLAQADEPDPELDRAVAVLAAREPLRDTSLCHGELGIIESLTVLARDHEQAAAAVVGAGARVLGALDRHGPRCGTPEEVPAPGLLTGLAGIGYGLLRLGFPERVPALLMLEPRAAT